MIEEYGRVVDVKDGMAWIEGVRTGTCSACSMHGGCGAGAIAKMLGQRRLRLRALNRVDAEIGEQVVIGIPETGPCWPCWAVPWPATGWPRAGLQGRPRAARLPGRLPACVPVLPGCVISAAATGTTRLISRSYYAGYIRGCQPADRSDARIPQVLSGAKSVC